MILNQKIQTNVTYKGVTAETAMLTLMKAMKLYEESLIRKELSQETIRGYQVDLKQYREFMMGSSNTPVFVSQITETSILTFVDELKKKNLVATSLNRKINSISNFCKFAVKKKWLAINPAEDVDRFKTKKKERDFLTIQEVQQIVEAIKTPIIQYVVILMSNTGLRISEAISLQMKDVDFENKVIHVIEGKGGKDRDIPMSQSLKEALLHYVKEVRPQVTSLYFFATKKTGSISQQYINKELKQTAKDLGIEKTVTSHVLRHSFASQLVKTDTHVSIIQRLLGHADVRTTSIYMHAEQEDLHDAVNAIKFLK